MSLVKDTWRQIVQRRLWPVAILLLAALVAVPTLLAKSPAPAPVPAASGAAATGGSSATDVALTKPVVSVASGDDARRHVVGRSKDPFTPQIIATPTPTSVTKGSATKTSTPSTGGAQAGGSATPVTVPTSTGGGTSTPSVGPGTGTGTGTGTGRGTGTGTPAKAKPSYPADSLTVRWSDGSSDGVKSLLQRDESLPQNASADTQPLLVYLGLDKGGKSARFLLDASIKVSGDGRCDGSGSACGTLHLRAGETEFLDVTDDTGAVTASCELDVIKIHASKKTLAAAARAARARHGAQAAVVRVAGTASHGGGAHQLGRGVAALLRSL